MLACQPQLSKFFMKIEITNLNQQQRKPISKKKVYLMSHQLLQETVINLIKKPPKHLSQDWLYDFKHRAIISLMLVSNQQIKILNQKWLGKNKSTDVLSFPLTLVPPSVPIPWELGEVIISTEKVSSQATEFGHSIERELAFLFVHGLLHLLGFDHQSKTEEKEMFLRQGKILTSAGFHHS